VIRNGLGAGQVDAEARMEVKDDFQAGCRPGSTPGPGRARGPGLSAGPGWSAGPGERGRPAAAGREPRRPAAGPGDTGTGNATGAGTAATAAVGGPNDDTPANGDTGPTPVARVL